jgi:hypothetical protein
LNWAVGPMIFGGGQSSLTSGRVNLAIDAVAKPAEITDLRRLYPCILFELLGSVSSRNAAVTQGEARLFVKIYGGLLQ